MIVYDPAYISSSETLSDQEAIQQAFRSMEQQSMSQQGQTTSQIYPVSIQPISGVPVMNQWLGSWAPTQQTETWQQSSQQQNQGQAVTSNSENYHYSSYGEGEETITVQGETGILANKQEIVGWSGQLPLSEYPINQDNNPEIIRKRSDQKLTYTQEICVKYLKPPTPPPPGDIVIRQEKDCFYPPAPPVVIRQQPARPETPAPLIFREAPPKRPPHVERKVITIPGKRIPPPPRKLVVERLAPLPPKPPSIFIERWLAYKEQKRRVIFEKSSEVTPYFEKPRNLIIQWEPPQVEVRRIVKDLGVVTADPQEYINRYRDQLKMFREFPDFIRQQQYSSSYTFSSQVLDRGESFRYQLYGDLQALSRIDLDREGLSEYKSYLSGLSSQDYSSQMYHDTSYMQQSKKYETDQPCIEGYHPLDHKSQVERAFYKVIATIDRTQSDRLTLSESNAVLAMLNHELNRAYDDEKVHKFLKSLNFGSDNTVSIDNFKTTLLNSV